MVVKAKFAGAGLQVRACPLFDNLRHTEIIAVRVRRIFEGVFVRERFGGVVFAKNGGLLDDVFQRFHIGGVELIQRFHISENIVQIPLQALCFLIV